MIFSPIIIFLSILCLPSIVETDPNNAKDVFIKAATSNYDKFYGFMAEIMKIFGAKLVKDENANEKIAFDFDNANKMMEKLEKLAIAKIVKKDKNGQQFICREKIKQKYSFRDAIEEILGKKTFNEIQEKRTDFMKWEEFVEIPRKTVNRSRSEIEKEFPRKYANEWLLFNLLYSFGTRIVAFVHGKRADGTNANEEIDEKSDNIGHNRIQAFIAVTKCFDLPEWASKFSIFDSLIKFEVISLKELEEKDQKVQEEKDQKMPVYGISIYKDDDDDGQESKSQRISKENFTMLKGLSEQKFGIKEAIKMVEFFQRKVTNKSVPAHPPKIIEKLAEHIWEEYSSLDSPAEDILNTSTKCWILLQLLQHISSNSIRMIAKNELNMESYKYITSYEIKLLKKHLKDNTNEINKQFNEIMKDKIIENHFHPQRIKAKFEKKIQTDEKGLTDEEKTIQAKENKIQMDKNNKCDKNLYSAYSKMYKTMGFNLYLNEMKKALLDYAEDEEKKQLKIEEHFVELQREWDDISKNAKIYLMKNVRYDLAINFEFNPNKEIVDRLGGAVLDHHYMKNEKFIDLKVFLSNEHMPIIEKLLKVENENYHQFYEESLDELRILKETIEEKEKELAKAKKELILKEVEFEEEKKTLSELTQSTREQHWQKRTPNNTDGLEKIKEKINKEKEKQKLAKKIQEEKEKIVKIKNAIDKSENLKTEIIKNIEEAKEQVENILEQFKEMKEHFAKKLEANNSNVGEGGAKEIA